MLIVHHRPYGINTAISLFRSRSTPRPHPALPGRRNPFHKPGGRRFNAERTSSPRPAPVQTDLPVGALTAIRHERQEASRTPLAPPAARALKGAAHRDRRNAKTRLLEEERRD